MFKLTFFSPFIMKKHTVFSCILYAFLLFLLLACQQDDDGFGEPVEPEVVEEEPVVVEEKIYFPSLIGDEWITKSVSDLGWNAQRLQEAIDYAESKNSYSLLILHKGRMVVEKYWQGSNINVKHTLESVTKAMVAFLIGVLQQDYALDINETVTLYLGEGWSKAAKEKESRITVKHLLTMTSGLDDNLGYSQDAGEFWYYNNAAYNTLFLLFKAVSGKDYQQYASDNLFSKIGMNSVVWQNSTLHSTAREMARFGIMILAEAKWNDEALLTDKTYYNGMLSSSQNRQQAYGYLWWLNGRESYYENKNTSAGPIFPAMPDDGLLAMGRLDQRIEVIPSLDLIIVRQGGDTKLPELGPGSFDNEFWLRLMRAINNEVVIPG